MQLLGREPTFLGLIGQRGIHYPRTPLQISDKIFVYI